MSNKVIVVAGPTGVGKTRHAEKLALELGGELINADSRQNYKFLDIGTNKGNLTATSEVDSANLPIWLTDNGVRIHHISFIEPTESYSAAQFQKNVALIAQELLKKNIVPIVVGGTGLYIQSLIEAEKYNLQVREATESRDYEIQEVQRLLKEEYPKIWEEINSSDRHNLPHLLGILRRHQREQAEQKDYEIINFLKGVKWDLRYVDLTLASHRIALMDRIEEMWPGLISEVENLLKMGYTSETKALQTIGYIQALDFLNKKIDAKTAMEQIFYAHWHYARRQRLWFEKFYLPKTPGWKEKEPMLSKLYE